MQVRQQGKRRSETMLPRQVRSAAVNQLMRARTRFFNQIELATYVKGHRTVIYPARQFRVLALGKRQIELKFP
jgi:hypothetical protein